ncbi:MAG: DUF58 domain-containing protein [Chitinophagaceae bacterium]|nr:DUF58 domain-containing protein [Chitinophagaceae bacterium]
MILSFFLNKKVYFFITAIVLVFVASYFYEPLYSTGFVLWGMLGVAILIDIVSLYSVKKGFGAQRIVAERFSLGDENKVILELKNNYPFAIKATVIDEIPFQFQYRNWKRKIKIDGTGSYSLIYMLTPKTRGLYVFHDINVYCHGPLGLVQRRYIFPQKQNIKVYPSFIQMRRYRLLAVSNRLQEAGIKKIRRLGHSMEFEQIKDYVRGDDYRTVNWKATARKGSLMVNNYTDERSQQIYCLINKGRLMKMPFGGMTLLDYAINASLVLLNVALIKQDKAGLITFEKNVDTFLAADKKPAQINKILEALYRQNTEFAEPDFEKLFSLIRSRITHRSLFVLFTNFESLEGLQRHLPALRKMAQYHLLMVVFFENTELRQLTNQKVKSLEDLYLKTIADKFVYEKKRIVKELHKNGIPAVLTPPELLTVNTLNKYLELKNRLFI